MRITSLEVPNNYSEIHDETQGSLHAYSLGVISQYPCVFTFLRRRPAPSPQAGSPPRLLCQVLQTLHEGVGM